MRRLLRLYRVLQTCEQYRIDQEKAKKRKNKERKRKEREEWLLLKQEEKDADSEDVKIGMKVLHFLFTTAGGLTLLAVLMLFTGLIRGFVGCSEDQLVGMFRILFLVSAALILVQCFPVVLHRLYREENLIYLMTIPFQPMELIGAKFLQTVRLAYGVPGIVILPVWLGFSIAGGFHRGLTLAVVLACLFLPLFVLLILFTLVILMHTYVLALVPKKPVISIAVPAAVVTVLGIGLLVLDYFLPGSIFVKLADILADILVFNFALSAIIRGRILLPVMVILAGMAVTVVLFGLFASYLYQRSLLHRWDLADDRKTVDFRIDRAVREHGCLRALVLRELRTVKGLKVYRLSQWFSSFLVPVLLLVFYGLIGALFQKLKPDSSLTPVQAVAFLVAVVVPITCVPGFLNRAVGTAFSRDAHSLEYLKLLPIDWEELLTAKAIASVFLCMKGSTPYILFGGLLLLSERRIPLWSILPALLLHLILVVWIAELKLMRDIRNPKLEWESAKELPERKGGYSWLIAIGAGVLVPLILGLILSLTVTSFWACLAVVFFIAAGLMVLGYFRLFIWGIDDVYELLD